MAEFGYHTIGSSFHNHGAAALYADRHTYSPAEDGVLDSIFVYCVKASAGTVQVRFALYDSSDDTLVAETVEIDVIFDSGNYHWYEAAVVGDVDVFAAKDYYFAHKQSDATNIRKDTGSLDHWYDFDAYGNDWPDPGDWTVETGRTNQYSNYATYTPSGAEVELAGTIAAQSGMTGALQVDRKLAGTIASQSGMNGALQVVRKLAGTIAAQSGLSGSLQVDRELAGVIAAHSGMSGSLTVERQPAGGTFASLTRDFWWLD